MRVFVLLSVFVGALVAMLPAPTHAMRLLGANEMSAVSGGTYKECMPGSCSAGVYSLDDCRRDNAYYTVTNPLNCVKNCICRKPLTAPSPCVHVDQEDEDCDTYTTYQFNGCTGTTQSKIRRGWSCHN